LKVTYPASTGTRLAVRYGYQRGFVLKAEDFTVPASPTLLWQANTHDARGHVTQEQFGNGQISTLGFDQTNGRLNTIQTGASAATQNLAYNWDGVGNLLSRQDNAQGLTEAFGYDLVYRLQSVQRNGVSTLTMAYNSIGNITSKSDVGSYTYPAPGAARPHAVTAAGAGSSIRGKRSVHLVRLIIESSMQQDYWGGAAAAGSSSKISTSSSGTWPSFT
jgi:YD repeat-containing protein